MSSDHFDEDIGMVAFFRCVNIVSALKDRSRFRLRSPEKRKEKREDAYKKHE